MNGKDFVLEMSTRLNEEGVKTGYKKLQEMILKNPAKVDIDFSSISSNFHKLPDAGAAAAPLQDEFSKLVLLKNRFDSSTEALDMVEGLKNVISKFSSMLGLGQIVMNGVHKTKEAIAELISLDSILTKISKTSTFTAKQLKELGGSSYETAGRYGKKAGEYIAAVQEMSAAGYKNSEGMAELSILTQSAGDMTSELAKDYLTAADAAFGYEGNIQKLNDLLDSQTQITNRNSVSMGELANATKVAGSLLADTKNRITSLRDPMEVLRELADVYNTLPKDSADRTRITDAIGGNYGSEILGSVLSNWSTYEKC